MSKPLMCHIVAGYPNYDACIEFLTKLTSLSIAALEVQIPFSDPIADGEAIMEANDVAIENGMTIARSFDLLKQVRNSGVKTDIYVMSYVQKLNHFGFEKFCTEAHESDIQGLIIPDLPYDTDEFERLSGIADKYSIQIVPVVSPGMTGSRLDGILKTTKSNYIYVTSRQGITGSSFKVHDDLEKITSKIRSFKGKKIFIGFGIATPDDVSRALEHGDIAVVGSAIVRKLKDSSIDDTIMYIDGLFGNASKNKGKLS